MKKKVILWAFLFVMLSGCGKQDETQKQFLENENTVEEDSDVKTSEGGNPEEKSSEEKIAGGEQQSGQQPNKGESGEQQSKAQQSEKQQPKDVETEFGFQDLSGLIFDFSSGAGAWNTELFIDSDGTFKGSYHDSDMGDAGDGYPNGTRYYSEFTGRFNGLEKIDEFTYKMKLESLELKHEPDKEEIKDDGIRYCYSTAYGLDDGEDFYLYLPGAELASLPESYLQWVGYNNLEDLTETKLPFYGIYNVNAEQGFSSAKYEEQSLSERIASEISYAEDQDADLEAKLQESATQAEMNEISAKIYQTWDDTLNVVWKLLESELDSAAMEALRTEERNWIKTKESEVKAAGEEFEGGSMQPMIENSKASELTKKRVYELAEYAK